MIIYNKASAETQDKSDITICVAPGENGIELSIKSVVQQQFGKAIRRTILDTLCEMGVESAIVEAEDFGAPDFVICARLETALKRAQKGGNP